MSLYKPKGRANYSYSFEIRGNRFSGSAGTGNRREAEKVVGQLKREAKDKLAKQAKFTAEGPMPFEIAASRYWVETGQHLANSVDCFRYLGWLERQIGKHTMLDKITDSKVALMVATRRGGASLTLPSNRPVIEPLRGLMRRAARVWKVPVADIDWREHWLREPQERIREASRDEETKLMAAMRDDYVPPVRFAFLTGCRLAEIVGLTWQRVDFFGRTITVIGKGDKKRVIPMTATVYDLLWELRDNHPVAVFTYVVQATRKHLKLVRGERRPDHHRGLQDGVAALQGRRWR